MQKNKHLIGNIKFFKRFFSNYLNKITSKNSIYIFYLKAIIKNKLKRTPMCEFLVTSNIDIEKKIYRGNQTSKA